MARRIAPWGWIAFWAGIAVGLRLAAAEYQLERKNAVLPDSELYFGYAESILLGTDYRSGDGGARRTPGYPIFIAGCWWAAGIDSPTFPPQTAEVRPILYAQAVLGGAVVLLAGVLCMLWDIDPRTRLLSPVFAAALATCDPFGIALAGAMLSETLFAFLMIAAVAVGSATSHSVDRRSLFWPALSGILAGAAVLVRPSGLLLAPLGLLGFANNSARLIALSAALVTLSPWWVRNAVVYQQFIPTTLNTGESLYDGWNTNADGGSNMQFIDDFAKGRAPAVDTDAKRQREVEDDRHWRTSAVTWASANPARVCELAVMKLRRFWSPWPNAQEYRSPTVTAACAVFSGISYLLIVVGLCSAVSRRSFALAIASLAPALYFMMLHAVFVSSVRYRVPAMPFAYVLAGVGAAWLIGQFLPSKTQRDVDSLPGVGR